MESVKPSTKQLYAYVDPFDTTTLTPKIPDGKSTTSIGVGFTSHGEFTMTETNHMLIVLVPGLNRFSYVFDGVRLMYPRGPRFGFTADNGFEKRQIGTSDEMYFKALDDIYMWRQVSLGLRISPTSALCEVEGSWESISVPISRFATDHTYESLTSSFNMTNLYFETLVGTNWANHETFKTGRVADLSDVVFSPLGRNTDHPFHHVENKMMFFGGNAEDGLTDTRENCIPWALLRNYIYDNTYNAVVIRIDTRNPIRLLITTRSNQERILQEGALERRYHTESDKSIVTPSHTQDMKRAATGNSHVTTRNAMKRLKFAVEKVNKKVVKPFVKGSDDVIEGAAKALGVAATAKAVLEGLKKISAPVEEVVEDVVEDISIFVDEDGAEFLEALETLGEAVTEG